MGKQAANKRKTPPKHSEIAEYWSTQYPTFPPAVDIGEPACFCCGYFMSSWDYDPENKKRDTWQKCWNATKSKLDRAHIIPHSLGGSNDVSNYVLLCKKCHASAPNVKDREYFLAWVSSTPNKVQNIRLENAIEILFERFPRVKKLYETNFNPMVHVDNFWERLTKEKVKETSYHFDGAGAGADSSADCGWAYVSFINDLIESGEIKEDQYE